LGEKREGKKIHETKGRKKRQTFIGRPVEKSRVAVGNSAEGCSRKKKEPVPRETQKSLKNKGGVYWSGGKGRTTTTTQSHLRLLVALGWAVWVSKKGEAPQGGERGGRLKTIKSVCPNQTKEDASDIGVINENYRKGGGEELSRGGGRKRRLRSRVYGAHGEETTNSKHPRGTPMSFEPTCYWETWVRSFRLQAVGQRVRSKGRKNVRGGERKQRKRFGDKRGR